MLWIAHFLYGFVLAVTFLRTSGGRSLNAVHKTIVLVGVTCLGIVPVLIALLVLIGRDLMKWVTTWRLLS